MSACNKKFIVSRVCGFCSGVKWAIASFDDTCAKYGTPVYVLHELVHNTFVSDSMRKSGAIFVDDIKDIPDGSVVMIGAHGVGNALKNEMLSRFTVVDATCPRVKALQQQAAKVAPEQELILLCKKGHPEAEGVVGHIVTDHVYPVADIADVELLPNLKSPVFLAQTTVSCKIVDDVKALLKKRFPVLKMSASVCDASYKRQNSAVALASLCELVFVVGSAHSSNAAELVNVVQSCGKKAFLIDDGKAISPDMLDKIKTVGITAGASTPDKLIEDVKNRLISLGYDNGGIADV